MSNKNIIISGIDLSKFCKEEDDFRHNFKEPYSNEKFIYASNGYILIRLSKFLAPDFNNPIIDKCPEYEKVIIEGANFKTILLSDIKEALDAFTPEYTDEYEEIECPECGGSGYEKCTECNSEKDCEECSGEGIIKTDKVTGKIMIKKAVSFFNVHIDFKYLTLVKEVVEVFPSNWLVSIRERLDPVQFKTNNVFIVVQPMSYW